MPEGPEIWRTADELDNVLKDKQIDDIYFSYDDLKDFETEINNETVTEVAPRGKAILTFFSNDLVLYSHNQLYGKWFVRKKGEEPDTNRQLRVAIHNEEYSAFLYSASDIEILSQDDVERHNYIKKLGPDVLHPSVTFDKAFSQFTNDRYQNRKLANLLLDQGFLSGIGNYLRSEILFVAKTDPTVKLRECSEDKKHSLAKAALKLSRRSYKTEGITNDPEIVNALKRENKKRSEYRHFVYNRTGGRCYKCGTVIEEDNTGGRKIYYCPSCQLDSGS